MDVEMRVLPFRSSTSNWASSRNVATTTSQSCSALRTLDSMNARPGAVAVDTTAEGNLWSSQPEADTTRSNTSNGVWMSSRTYSTAGSAKRRFCVLSESTRVER